jgi:hypothetical protein
VKLKVMMRKVWFQSFFIFIFFKCGRYAEVMSNRFLPSKNQRAEAYRAPPDDGGGGDPRNSQSRRGPNGYGVGAGAGGGMRNSQDGAV